MLSKPEKLFTLIFSIIVIAELVCGSIASLDNLHYVFKPAIVSSLLLFFWIHSKTITPKLRYMIVLALVFSLIGDVLLMFVALSPNYFLFGLVAFLLAHIMYVFAFFKTSQQHIKANWIHYWSITLCFGIILSTKRWFERHANPSNYLYARYFEYGYSCVFTARTRF